MIAVLKKELSYYFHTIMGFIFVSVFMAFASYYFFAYNIVTNSSDLSTLFETLMLTLVFLIPVLTMRLLSEERKTKSDQILLTSPVSIYSVVAGKFIAAFTVFLIPMILSLVFPYIVASNGNPEPGVITAVYIGFILIGAVFNSIGLFISSLTENQVISAIFTFGVLLFIEIGDSLRGSIDSVKINSALKWLSITERYKSFCIGVLDFADVFYLLSVCALFLFLTVKIIEKRRWS